MRFTSSCCVRCAVASSDSCRKGGTRHQRSIKQCTVSRERHWFTRALCGRQPRLLQAAKQSKDPALSGGAIAPRRALNSINQTNPLCRPRQAGCMVRLPCRARQPAASLLLPAARSGHALPAWAVGQEGNCFAPASILAVCTHCILLANAHTRATRAHRPSHASTTALLSPVSAQPWLNLHVDCRFRNHVPTSHTCSARARLAVAASSAAWLSAAVGAASQASRQISRPEVMWLEAGCSSNEG